MDLISALLGPNMKLDWSTDLELERVFVLSSI